MNLQGTIVAKAYQLFFLEYLRLIPEEVPMVEKSERRIVVRSCNFCPVVEACRDLGLDTAEVCRRVYEKPVQLMIAQIDSKLRFKRNYSQIRSHADYCEEIIEIQE